MDYIITFLAILFGWALGLIQMKLTDKRRHQSACKAFVNLLKNELYEIQVQMTGVVILSMFDTGDVKNKNMMKYAEIFNAYKGYENSKFANFSGITRKIDSKSIEIIAEERKGKHISCGLKSYTTPFLRSHLHQVSCLSTMHQQGVFKFLLYIDQYNQEVERYWVDMDMSFNPSIVECNRKLLVGNIQTHLKTVGNIGQQIIDLTIPLIQELENEC